MPNLQQQINQLKDKMLKDLEELHKLEEQVKNEPKHESGWFDGEEGKIFYYIEFDGSICEDKYSHEIDGDLLQYNTFLSKELAEDVNLEMLVYRTIRKWRDTYDKDWNNNILKDYNYSKYYIYFADEIQHDYCYTSIAMNQTYFSSESLVQQCIEENKELLKKYFNR